jgi:hypothetical protein
LLGVFRSCALFQYVDALQRSLERAVRILRRAASGLFQLAKLGSRFTRFVFERFDELIEIDAHRGLRFSSL